VGRFVGPTAPSPSQRRRSISCSTGDALPGARHTVIELSAAMSPYPFLMQCTSAEVTPLVWRITGNRTPVSVVGCTQGRAQSSGTRWPIAESSVCPVMGTLKAAAGKYRMTNHSLLKAP